METPYRILIVEDVPTDAELNEKEIQQVLTECIFERVETEEYFLRALDEFKPDIIISDYMMPSFDGLTALKLTLQKTPLTPFIIVTGSRNEDTAVDCMKAGATNYVIKQYLKRLGTAVLRALEEKKIRMERLKADEALKQSEYRYRTLFENMAQGVFYRRADGLLIDINPAALEMFGLSNDEFLDRTLYPPQWKVIHEDGSYFPGEDHPSMIALKTGEHVRNVIAGVYNPRKEDYVWMNINATPQFRPGEQKPYQVFVTLHDITERMQAEAALRTSEAQLSNAMKIAKLGHWEYDVASDLFTFNDHFYAIFRITAAEVGGYTMSSSQYAERFVHPDDVSVVSAEIQKAIETNDPLYSRQIEHRIIYADGEIGYITVRFIIVKDAQGKTVKTYGANQDITERKRAEETLRVSEAALYDVYFAEATIHMILSESLENIPLEDFLQKALNMIFSIPWIAFESIGSISLVEDGADVLVMKTQSNLHESLKKLCTRVPFGICLCGKAAQTQKIEYADHTDERQGICYEGIHPYAHYSVPILFSGKTLGVLNIYLKEGHIRDKKEEEFLRTVADTLAGIIMRKKAEERIEYLAYYDALTGLPNRNLFIDRLNQGIARAEPTSKIVAVLITDIDRFRSINDSYGTGVGDKVLNNFAERLLTAVRKGDTIARLGSDEFGIALLDVANLDDVIPVMEKIMKHISHPLKIGSDEIALTFSAGISIYPHDGKNPQALLKSAGLALGIAKKEGRKTCQFYTEDLNVKALEFLLMEKNLNNAIKNEEFILHYQPYWDINTKKMVGMEALVRWQSPELGLVSPARFIPVLEDTGMIIQAGEWILGEAMRQVKEWQNNGYPVVPVSVNMSLVQFRQKDLAGMIKKIMKDRGYYPSLLTLEITESAFMQDIEFTRSALTAMKEIGCSVSIDDFGTGYSSLAYLKRFPVDNLKIDISFIREMVKDPDSASIVVAIINMAHTLNLKTIAEGIETEEQWNFLRLLRCDMGQGFYLSKPLPAWEMEKLLIGGTNGK